MDSSLWVLSWILAGWKILSGGFCALWVLKSAGALFPVGRKIYLIV